MHLIDRIFSIHSDESFEKTALEVFSFQYEHNSIYRSFVDSLGGYIGLDFENLVLSNWLYETMGVVFIVLSLLSTFERLVTIKENLFIRIGQKTLSICIIHMMLLYGAVIKSGIGTFFSGCLH